MVERRTQLNSLDFHPDLLTPFVFPIEVSKNRQPLEFEYEHDLTLWWSIDDLVDNRNEGRG